MSFNHVLPSNTSAKTFPKNHASSYSTPLSNPIHLDGDWEVACLSLFHSNCIQSLNNDSITIEDRSANKMRMKKPYRLNIHFNKSQGAKSLVAALNQALVGFVKFELKGEYLAYTFQTKDYVLYLSQQLTAAFYMSNVLTDYDNHKGNPRPVKISAADQCYVILIPKSFTHTRIELKKRHESLDAQGLIKRFRERVTSKYPYLTLVSNDNVNTHIIFLSSELKQHAYLFSPDLHKNSGYRQNGIDPNSKQNRYYAHDFRHSFSDQWDLIIYDLSKVEVYEGVLKNSIHFEPQMFQSTKQLCAHITEKINHADIELTATRENKASLNLKKNTVSVKFSSDLRDILGFDKTTYQGHSIIVGSGNISLTRRINYFYIYSNIGDMIRIGDTEAPLLCHVPFNPKPCTTITERLFKQPTYVKVRNLNLSQIDIGIYDDAGKLIPFHPDAITTLCLHFRRV